ncbi:hypothetical protein DXG01_011975 [Tephrocybe rancida]|nr:hypothetical protein DXG01_011975 [Tephrocybe rancida]
MGRKCKEGTRYVRAGPKRMKLASVSTESATQTQENNTAGLLFTMPLDIIYEVFAKLAPMDLLSLSCTSKSLRETLSAANSLSLWKSVRDTHGVPKPPIDFSELQWASLLGSTSCQFTGSIIYRLFSTVGCMAFQMLISLFAVDFADAARRTSEVSILYVVESKFKEHFKGEDSIVLNFIPYTNVSGYSETRSKYFWKFDIVDMMRRWKSLKSGSSKEALGKFRKERQDFVASIREDAVSYIVWSKQLALDREAGSKARQEAKVSAIRQKFRDLGYEDKDMYPLRYQKSVNSPTELTEEVWASIRPSLEKVVIGARKDRLESEMMKWLNNRLGPFRKLFDAYVNSLPPPQWRAHPPWEEVIRFPVFNQILQAAPNVAVDKRLFTSALAKLPGIANTRIQERKAVCSKLCFKHLRAAEALGPKAKSISAEDALDLAASIFRCTLWGCGVSAPVWDGTSAALVFGRTEVVGHRCSCVDDKSRQSVPFTSQNAGTLKVANMKTRLCFFPDASTAALRLIKLTGMDPCRATVKDMDQRNHHFLCKACAESNRKTVYTWRTAVAHAVSDKPVGHDSFTILAPAQMKNVLVYPDADDETPCWACNRCPEHLVKHQPRAVVRDHIIQEHLIKEPQEVRDFFCFVKARRTKKLLPSLC